MTPFLTVLDTEQGVWESQQVIFRNSVRTDELKGREQALEDTFGLCKKETKIFTDKVKVSQNIGYTRSIIDSSQANTSCTAH